MNKYYVFIEKKDGLYAKQSHPSKTYMSAMAKGLRTARGNYPRFYNLNADVRVYQKQSGEFPFFEKVGNFFKLKK